MKPMYAMWPTADANNLFMVLGPKYLCAGAKPAYYLRTDVPVMFKPPLTGEKLLRWDCVDHTREEAEADRQRDASQCPQCCTAFAEEREWPKAFEEPVKRARGSATSVTLAADVFRAMFDTTCPDFGAPDPYTRQNCK